MADNRSLDEFGVGGEDADDVEPDADPDPTAPAEGDAARTVDGLEPIAETFAWSARGAECRLCGETVETRWRDGEALVCEDCKAW
ncbi:MAG: hypothetical protein ABEH59_00490 [Halobacteriales archaeon]